MKTPADKSPEPQRQAAAHEAPQQQDRSDAELKFVDNRPETASFRRLQETVNNSPRRQEMAQLKAMMDTSPRRDAMRSLQALVDNSPRRLLQRQAEPEAAALVQAKKESGGSIESDPIGTQFIDNRPKTAKLRQLQEDINNSPRMLAQRQQIATMSGKAVQRVEGEEELMQGKFDPIQRVEEEELLQGKFSVAQRVEEEELMQGKFAPVQRVEEEDLLQGKFEPVQRVEEDELIQGKFNTVQFDHPQAEKANNTGLPDPLKQGIENLSGMSMDSVKVHYNSSKPAQLNALAYAQGTDIHVGAGHEKHVPHEAWHVVQQAQGRAKSTMQTSDGVRVNDDQELEQEAEVMGAKAVAWVVQAKRDLGSSIWSAPQRPLIPVIQRYPPKQDETTKRWVHTEGSDDSFDSRKDAYDAYW